ncbi:MAG: LamG-like jellyroll fold domain-containing protein [Egibacteraceae bacterium]
MTTVQLCHFDGADAATTASDEIDLVLWSLNSGAQLDTAQKRFGVSSLLVASHFHQAVGSEFSSPHAGDWTFEFFYRVSATAGTSAEVDLDGIGIILAVQIALGTGTSEIVALLRDGANGSIGSVSGAISVSADTWYHWALVRDTIAGEYRLYWNGLLVDTLSTSTDVAPFDTLKFGGSISRNAWYDEARISTEALYFGSTYTPPSSPFTIDPLSVLELVYYDRVRQFTSSVGVGDLLLTDVPPTYQSFAVVGDGNQCVYSVNDVLAGGTAWEVGIALVSIAGPDITLERLEVLASSNANALVDFAAGPKDVHLDAPADLVNTLIAYALDHETRIGDLETNDGTQDTTLGDHETRIDALEIQSLTLGTEQDTTSGTTIDFSVPAGAKRVTINFAGVSTDAASTYMVQLGDAGGPETTGYDSKSIPLLSAATPGTMTTLSNALIFGIVTNAADLFSGTMTLILEDAANFTWSMTGIGMTDGSLLFVACGRKALSQELSQIRITTNAGDTFDAGAINITYET